MSTDKCEPASSTIRLHFPSFSVRPSHKLVGIVEVGDLHILSIPQQFFATVIIHAVASFLSQHVAPDGQVAHQHRFGHRTRVVEGGSQSLMLFASKASLTGIDPFALVTV